MLAYADKYKEVYPDFIAGLIHSGFVVKDDTDEIREAECIYTRRKESDTYKLMILPTYACNLDCWYCTQKHRGMRLSPEGVTLIKRHIMAYLEANGDVKKLMLSWFGGEPLIAFDNIIDISHFAIGVCKERGIGFANTITTNGTLLTPDKFAGLRDVSMCFFQITLDGCRDDHDKVKRLPHTSAYEQTLSGIRGMLEAIPTATCLLRFNYSTTNIKPEAFINGITERIPAGLRSRVSLSFKKVWQVGDTEIDSSDLDKLYALAAQACFRTDTRSNFSLCYVESKHFNTIFPNCRAEKCDNIDPDTARGHLSDNGTIVWNSLLPYTRHSPFTSGESDCRTCKYLPVCNGPCPAARDSMWHQHGRIKCAHKHPDIVCKERIIRFCEAYM